MNSKSSYIIVISTITLLACNGGSGNQNSIPTPAPAPSPTPNPVPTPSPTPSPSPNPSPSPTPLPPSINTYAYIVSSNGRATTIKINPDGSFTNEYNWSTFFDLPTAITFNNGYAYVVNSANSGSLLINSVSRCNTNGLNHTLAECETVANGFSWPRGLAFTKDYNYAYITNTNNSYTALNSGYISKCKVNKLTESFEECSTTATGFNFPWNITTVENNAYISSPYTRSSNTNTGSISKCQISTDGNLTQCTNLLSNLNQSSGIAVYYGYLYYTSIVNNSTGEGKITSYQILGDGSLNTCKTAVGNLYAPINIAFNNNHAYIITNKNNLYPSIYICDVNIDQTLSNCSGFPSSDQYQAIAFKEIIGS